MSAEPTILTGKPIVSGRGSTGRVMMNPLPAETNYFLLVGRLTTADYDRLARSVGVIVEAGCSCDHAAVICRILGVPIIQLQVAFSHLRDGQRVFVDGRTGGIHLDPTEPSTRVWTPVLPDSTWARLSSVGYQISILGEDCVRAVNNLGSDRAEQFFLREDFLWLRRNECPFHSILARGVEGTAAVIHDSLLPIVKNLNRDQTLNFRSLDARSDEFHFISDLARGQERNPQLGLHGIRHLLRKPGLLHAELRAVDMLRRSGYTNVALSLPFLTDLTELNKVREIAADVCKNEPPIGVFVETPAAALKTDALLRWKPPFLCVGTKDLAQLMLGCDRTNPNVRHLYNLADTAVVDTVANVVAKCRSASVPAYVYTGLDNIESYVRKVPQIENLSVTRGEFEMIVAGLRQFLP